MARHNTFNVYEGPSLIDGAPIVVLISGFARSSKNEKTGDMLQAWIVRSDVDPVTAAVTGRDASICGTCPHRGWIETITLKRSGKRGKAGATITKLRERSCYVAVGKAPAAVYKSFRANRVPSVSIDALADKLAGRVIRFGAYGDPAAVPVAIWERLAQLTKGHTGYTHAWRSAAPALRSLVMASVDSPAEYSEAQALGCRTFRVKSASEPILSGEIACPASDEAGKRTDCATCKLCDGNKGAADKRRSTVINVHGIGAGSFVHIRTRMQVLADSASA